MKITSFNANGIRAAARKGFLEWLSAEQPDVLCVQETKAQAGQLGDELRSPDGYDSYFCDAEKRGYSGVAIYTRRSPDSVVRGVGFEDIDREGRWIEARFGDLTVVCQHLEMG